jgi:hypothetical protein
LINAVDKFVIYDDVNYIKQGWIHRNRILLNGNEYLFTLQVKGAGSFKKINEINIGNLNDKLFKTIIQAYRKAPFYSSVLPCIEEIFLNNEKNLSKFIIFYLKKIADYLGIETALFVSSEIEKNNELKAQEKVIEICKIMQAEVYINASGGKDLYDKERFLKDNIELKFLKSDLVQYKQFDNQFIPGLSIIDVMMFNSKDKIQEMLSGYELE